MRLMPRRLINLEAPPKAVPAETSNLDRLFREMGETLLPFGEEFMVAATAAMSVCVAESPRGLLTGLRALRCETGIAELLAHDTREEQLLYMLLILELDAGAVVAFAAVEVWDSQQPTAWETLGWTADQRAYVEGLCATFDDDEEVELVPVELSRLSGRHRSAEDGGFTYVVSETKEGNTRRCTFVPTPV
jgi:hypothetical protein